jgi:hypothetical protein
MGALVTVLAASFGLVEMNLLGGNRCYLLPKTEALTADARSAVDQFIAARGRCPRSERELIEGRFLHSVLKDRWRQRLFYTCVAAGDGVGVEVRSAGLDRAFWTEDDVVAR